MSTKKKLETASRERERVESKPRLKIDLPTKGKRRKKREGAHCQTQKHEKKA